MYYARHIYILDKLYEYKHPRLNYVVVSRDGAQLSGLFCVLSNVIEKLKLDNDVDIFVTVRELQCIRPQIVETFVRFTSPSL